ncbi:hypothetical protein AVEN_239513-1 [Araneus ventricosus]|uniref:Uncharacterized protein n=1 Tax=Araneus ventricosus TaxID=182803 RepID=A0A4Y2PZV8_ARAVE|nr:hypothetical protein AVEN_239513-1 [Araneus ventricosus]
MTDILALELIWIFTYPLKIDIKEKLKEWGFEELVTGVYCLGMTQSTMAGDNHEERQARSLALEKAYVHDVYDQIAPHFTDTRYRPWPRVKQFLLELEPGSLVADVGKFL